MLAGEKSINAAIREVQGELGLALSTDQMKRVDRILYENRLEDIWLVNALQASTGTPVSGVDVSDWKWVSRGMLDEMVSQGKFSAYSYINEILKEPPFSEY